MKKQDQNHTIKIVFVLSAACAFAASVLMVLMLGVRVYGDVQKTSDSEYNGRICLSYLTAKIHGNDHEGSLRVEEFFGISALYIEEQIDDVEYYTIIYAYEGWLRELFCEKGLDLSPDAGTPILETDYVSFNLENPGLISIEYISESGGTRKAFVHLRSSEGVRQ